MCKFSQVAFYLLTLVGSNFGQFNPLTVKLLYTEFTKQQDADRTILYRGYLKTFQIFVRTALQQFHFLSKHSIKSPQYRFQTALRPE
jgi:hypothetical protein